MRTSIQIYRLIKLALLASLPLATAVHADTNIERSCSAKYRVYIPESVFSDGRPQFRVDGHEPLAEQYTFSARRGCGATVPNRCRQRASEAALACMTDHAKNPGSRPASCTRDGVHGYTLTNLEAPVKAAACKHAKGYWGAEKYNNALPVTLKTSIKAIVSGDDGCDGKDSKSVVKYVATFNVECTQ